MKLLDLASDLLSATPLEDVSVEPDTNNTVIFKALTLPPTHPFISSFLGTALSIHVTDTCCALKPEILLQP